MPDFLSLYGIEPALDSLSPAQRDALGELGYPALSDDLHTFDTLREVLLALARADRSLDLKVLARGGHDWFGMFVFRARQGDVAYEGLSLSLQPEASAPLTLTAAPEVPLALDTDADAFLDDLHGAFEELSEVEAEEQTLTLAFRVEDREALLRALSAVAPHLEQGPAQLLVETDAAFERLTLDRGLGARLEPLHVWHPDPELRAFAQRHVAGGGAAASVAAGAAEPPPTSKRDPAQALTTGSARSREDAVYGLPRGPEAAGALRAALAAPENAGKRFESFRAELWDALVRRVGVEALPELLRALEQDPPLAAAIYGHLSTLDDPRAHEALVRGFKTETGETRRLIRQVIWRQERAVERLVRSELVPSFGRDPAWSDAIVALLKDEWIRVPRAWLGDAPPAGLVEKLGALVV